MEGSNVTDAQMSGVATQPPIPLRLDQVDQAAAMLARAFHDDSLPRFVFPDAVRRRQHLPALFAWWLRDALRDGDVLCLGAVQALAVWTPPQVTPDLHSEAAEAAWREGTWSL